MATPQDSTFRPGIAWDQHDRPFAVNFDKRSGYPVGLISPKGWSAPWMPDQSFFKFSQDNATRFDIDYKALLAQRLADHEQWAADMRQSAMVRGWSPEDTAKQANLLEIVGKKPLPIEPIVAAMQGNTYILGLTKKVDPRLEPFMVKRSDRVSRLVANMPDFSTVEEPDNESDEHFDQRIALEEQYDPEATGGKKVPKKPKAKREVAA